jgi:hypothetical protein
MGCEVGILQEDGRDSKVVSVVHDVVRRRDLTAGKFEGPRVVSKCGAGACRSSSTREEKERRGPDQVIVCEKNVFQDRSNKLIFTDLQFDGQTGRCMMSCCAISGGGCVTILSEIHETSCNQILETFPLYVDDFVTASILKFAFCSTAFVFNSEQFPAKPPSSLFLAMI